MFDVGFSELVLLAIVALVVLGPEKLPHAARVAGAWVARIRRTISTVQAEIEREVSAQELKTRMEKEFGPGGMSNLTGNFVGQVKEEAAAIGKELKATENMIAPAFTVAATASTLAPAEHSEAVAAAAPAEALPTAVDAPPPSVLADVATPLDSVDMDGEAAYRQWLDSQKRSTSAGISLTDKDPAS